MITSPDSNKKSRQPKKWFETATAAQYEKIIALLTPCGKTMNTHEFRRNGIMQPAARTKELRERHGYPIERVGLVTIFDDWGFPHRNVAMYALVAQR